MVSSSVFEIEGFMVRSVYFRVLRRSFRASGSLFSNFGHKNTHTEIKKQDWKNTYLFLVTDRSDRYLAWRPEYINLIRYINISIIANKLQ